MDEGLSIYEKQDGNSKTTQEMTVAILNDDDSTEVRDQKNKKTKKKSRRVRFELMRKSCSLGHPDISSA